MPHSDPVARGIAFEAEVVESLGLKAVSRSGAGWSDKSDGRGALRVSCKSKTLTKRSWPETRRQLDEAITMAAGTGETPALAIEDQDGAQFLLMRLADASEVLTSEALAQRKPKRSDVVRQAARTPVLLRDSNG